MLTIQSSTVKKGAFCLAYLLLLTFSMMGHIPGLGGYLNQLTQIAVAILLLLCIVQNFRLSRRTFICLCVTLIYSIVLIVQTGFAGMFKLVLLIAASRSIDFKSLLKFDAVCRVVLTAIIFWCCFAGIAPNKIAVYPDGSVRYSWGFQNCNHLGLAMVILIAELLYIWDMKMTVRRTICVIGILTFSEIFSGSRTAGLAGVFIIACAFLYTIKRSVWAKPIIKWCSTYNVWIMAGITLVLTVCFERKKSWAIKIDQLLSARLTNIEYFHQHFPITLLGNDLTSSGRTLDTLYAYLWFGLGIIGFFAVCWAITAIIKIAYAKNAVPFVIIMLFFIVYGLSERLWIYVDYNIMLIAFREMFFHDVFEEGLRC